jgi:hypothetical protein
MLVRLLKPRSVPALRVGRKSYHESKYEYQSSYDGRSITQNLLQVFFFSSHIVTWLIRKGLQLEPHLLAGSWKYVCHDKHSDHPLYPHISYVYKQSPKLFMNYFFQLRVLTWRLPDYLRLSLCFQNIVTDLHHAGQPLPSASGDVTEEQLCQAVLV